MLNIKSLIFNPFRVNTYIVWADGPQCLIIDPGCDKPAELDRLDAFIADNGLVPIRALVTHGHVDHTYGAAHCQEKYGIPIYMNPLDEAALNWTRQDFECLGIHVPRPFQFTKAVDGDIIGEGDLACKVLDTPGHSPGGVSFLFENDAKVFTGDALFAGCIGRTDLYKGDLDQLLESIRTKLMVLDGDIEVLPGHGHPTDIATERTTNPFIYERLSDKELYGED